MMRIILAFLLPITLIGQDYYSMTAEEFSLLPEANKEVRWPIDNKLLDAAVFHATNAERSRIGTSVLEYSKDVHRNMISHTRWMRRTGKFEHSEEWTENIKEWGGTFFFLKGSTYTQAGADLVRGWIESPGHYETMIDSRWNKLGCSVKMGMRKLFASQGFSY